MRGPLFISLALPLLAIALIASCNGKPKEESGGEGIAAVELQERIDRRLAAISFSIVQDDPVASAISREILSTEFDLPESWELQFAGKSVEVPSLDRADAVGIQHSDGRTSCAYLFHDIRLPEYSEIVPLALVHYHVPDPKLDVVLLLVCFQTDPGQSLAGLGVKAVAIDGWETGAPFAVATRPEYLQGKKLYEEFLGSNEEQAVGGRSGWDRGILIFSRLSDDVILSIYNTWY